ncbi:MAG: hypothetical protein A2Z99_18100 [Treponema sp. GWB1_62_6]|nr:MAG: hypothetical protein A2001_04950 [Treponema sp. GWC1_61_84]OHE67726.1 MAG: hypothetical protein A2Y36_06655 [Treponema sp. GWA1_62_8]OHE69404.1 MAG: hypothetical protein A2Z99_18100 [Treponema sp. GWB1_62_6]OHE74909.1 MAG: hypothetical protein A2413_20355 [Treponema sp. RIFOXYC1_FULL_61_9]
MNILLDTHAFLWWTGDQDRLPAELLRIMRLPETRLVLSVASSWEAMIKIGLGKLKTDEKWNEIVAREIRENALAILPVKLEHTYTLHGLPPLNRDPFDRMLIAQSICENLTLATGDPLIRNYPDAKTIWE